MCGTDDLGVAQYPQRVGMAGEVSQAGRADLREAPVGPAKEVRGGPRAARAAVLAPSLAAAPSIDVDPCRTMGALDDGWMSGAVLEGCDQRPALEPWRSAGNPDKRERVSAADEDERDTAAAELLSAAIEASDPAFEDR
jgi:hypothetical protein